MDPVIFDWAKKLASNVPKIQEINMKLDRPFIQVLDRHVSMYRNDDTSETYLGTLVGEAQYRTMYFQKVNNFDEVKKAAPWLVDLLLRNGEYLYTYLTTGANLKIVDIEHVRTFKKPPESPKRG